jgi:hypothetical protein
LNPSSVAIDLKFKKGSKYYPDNFLKDIIKFYLKSDVIPTEKAEIAKLDIQLQKVLQFYNQFRSEELAKIYSNLHDFLSLETIQYLNQVSIVVPLYHESVIPLYYIFFLTFSFFPL